MASAVDPAALAPLPPRAPTIHRVRNLLISCYARFQMEIIGPSLGRMGGAPAIDFVKQAHFYMSLIFHEPVIKVEGGDYTIVPLRSIDGKIWEDMLV